MTVSHIKGPMLRQIDSGSRVLYQEYYHVFPRRSASTPYRVLKTFRPGQSWGSFGTADSDLSLIPPAQAKAYDKWHAKANARAENALNILEGKKSLAMIAKRASQLYKAAVAVKSLRLGDALRALEVTLPPKKRNGVRARANTPASMWLELTFGWMPMVQDIGTSVEILQRDFPVERIKASGSNFLEVKVGNGFDPLNPYSWGGYSLRKAVASYSGIMRITNPNVLLASQLGFVNPAAIVWDAVPFSFVVDWFIPVGKFLKSFSNNFGFEIDDPISAWGQRFVTDAQIGSGFGYVPPKGFVDSFYYIRTKSPFARPSLFSRARFPPLDSWHAATSVSLLIQQLNRCR